MSDCVADIPDEVLNCTWRDNDLARLALHIVSWEELAPFWGLTEAEEEEIKRDNPKYAAQKLAALRWWKAKSQDAATYHQLVRVFRRLGKMELVEKVREIVLSPEEVPVGGPEDVLSSYQEFLRKSYVQLPHPGMLANQWPIMNKAVYIQLSLSKQPKLQRKHLLMQQLPTFSSLNLPEITRRHENDECMCESEAQEVHLAKLLSESSGRSCLVIRGLPGSGKTTLTWHASQQWAKKKEFQQFSLFLSIPLRSIQVQQATCLADLIPHPDQEQKKAIAQAISARDGEGVCFWFDGWDEMPQGVQKESFIASFVQGDTPGSSLPKSTTVVTTRPEGFPKSLEEIWLNGLSVDQVNEIISKSVEGTDHDPSELITNLDRNPSLQAFCLTVPINVAILVSLFFLFQSGLPNTRTQLFKCLVLNLLLRNLQSRWKLGITSLKSFAALPNIPAGSFKSICKVAFDGIIYGRTTFLKSDILALQAQNALSHSTFGLMEIRPRMEWYGVEEELTFLHTTLQEFLAAVHLTTLKIEEHKEILLKMLRSKSGHQILQFYVGLIRPETSGILNVLCDNWVDVNSGRLYYCCWNPEDLPFFVTFVNCVFEAQSGQLCQKLMQLNNSKGFDLCLQFRLTHFNTADFCHLGYFIGWLCQQKTCKLVFEDCHISPQQYKMFVDQIKEVCTNEFFGPSLSLHHVEAYPTIIPTKLRFEQIRALCGLVKDTNLVSEFCTSLFFDNVPLPVFTDYYAAMKSIVEAFARNTSCNGLLLNYDPAMIYPSMTTTYTVARYSEYYAILLLTFCRHVEIVAYGGVVP